MIGRPPPLEEPAPGPAAELALATFVVLWAIATLFHEAAYPWRVQKPEELLVLLPTFWLLLRPTSLPRFVLAAGVQVASVLIQGPANVTNHWVFTTFVNATLLVAVARMALSRSGHVQPAAVFREFAPVARVELVILYAFAVLHKLNADFLNPALSCATTHYSETAARLTFLPPAPDVVAYGLIGGTLAVEIAIPVLVCVRRTRIVGLALGGAFHLLLALNPRYVFFDFSSMIFAMLFLFVPYDFAGALRELRWSPAARRAWARWGPALRRATSRAALAAGLGLAVWALLAHLAPRQTIWRVHLLDPRLMLGVTEGARAVFLLYGGALLAAFLLVVRSRPILPAVRGLDRIGLPHPLYALLLALLVLNGLSPYLGLKTQSSFSMFSNLRTEDGRSNHLFLPATLQIASYQRDMVSVLDSSHPRLQRLAVEGLRLPWFEFRRIASERPEASVTFVRAGRERRVPRIGDDPELGTPPPLLARWLLKFREVDPPERGTPCRH